MIRTPSYLLILSLVLFSGCQNHKQKTLQPRSHVLEQATFNLIWLSCEEAQAFMSYLGLSTQSASMAPQRLSVKGTASDIYRTGILLNLVDCNTLYTLECLGPVAIARDLPTNNQIAASMDNVVIGTFANPPTDTNAHKVLMDIHEDKIIVIVPRTLYRQLQDAIRGKSSDQKQDIPLDSPETIVNNVELKQDDLSVEIETSNDETPITPSPLIVSELIALEPQVSPKDSRVLPLQLTYPEYDVNALESEWSVPQANHVHSTEVLTDLNVTDANEFLDLSLPDTMRLTELLELAGQYLGFDMVYEPQKIPDDAITLKLHGQLQGKVRIQDLYALLQTVLKFKGLAMVRKDEHLIAVVSVEDIMDADPALIDPSSEKIQAGDLVITRMFVLQYIDATSAKTFLESMNLSLAISVVESTQTMFVTCYTHRLDRVERLIDLIDQQGDQRFFKIRVLRYTSVENVMQQIRTLAGQLQDMHVVISTAVDSGPNLGPITSGQRTNTNPNPPSSSKEAVYLDMDVRTNRIITIGSKPQLNLIEKLITALDVPLHDQRQMLPYRLAHIQADQAMNIISQLLETNTQDSRRITGPAPLPQSSSRQGNRSSVMPSTDKLQIVMLHSVNTLLVNATAQQHQRIDMILLHADAAPDEQRLLKSYPVRYLEAVQVMTTLSELDLLNSSTSNRSPNALSPSPTPPPATSGRIITRQTDKTDLGPKISVLEATNALLVLATEFQHERLEILLEHIDVPTQDVAIPYEIYFLENQPPEHMAETLQKIIQETVTDPEGKIQQVLRKSEDRIVIVPDEPTSSLIVYANKQNQDWINKLIKTLDRRRPQVLIDVTLVEIRKTDEFSYDLNLITAIPDMIDTSGQLGSFVSGGQTVPENLQSLDRSSFTEFQTNSGEGSGFYGDSHINVLLTAMQSKNYGRILAKPKILVNDNETGTIKTTEMTYVSVKSSIPVSSGGAGDNTTLIETAVQYEPYDAGITLEITPHTSKGDLLRLDIVLNRSDFGTVTGEAPPDVSSSDLTTNVTVPDASTIILGGMLRLNQTKAGKKVPILGDLPLIGMLFRGASNKDIQNKLYIFVRAEIIRPEETLKAGQDALERMSDQDRAAFEQHEKDFQDYKTLPMKRNERLDPENVLEMK